MLYLSIPNAPDHKALDGLSGAGVWIHRAGEEVLVAIFWGHKVYVETVSRDYIADRFIAIRPPVST